MNNVLEMLSRPIFSAETNAPRYCSSITVIIKTHANDTNDSGLGSVKSATSDRFFFFFTRTKPEPVPLARPRVFQPDCTIGLRRCDRWRRPLISPRDSPRLLCPRLIVPASLFRHSVRLYCLMANAVAKTAIAALHARRRAGEALCKKRGRAARGRSGYRPATLID